MNAIICEQVTKQFPNEARPAVDHISLEVASGDFVVLLGPSGCGKTTLLKMINRLYEPTSGRILVEGIEVHDLPATALRRRIGYVIQQVGLFPHMTIEQNIAVVPQLLGWERSRTQARIEELLQMVGLPKEYRRRAPRQLSGGEQQRVGLARALAADPAILLMDEPFAALDAITRGCLQEELRELQQKLHKTILFVTHDVEEALRLADRIAVLRSGQLVQFGSPLEIVARPHDPFVQELVGGKDLLRRLSLLEVRAALALQQKPAGIKAAPGNGNSLTIHPEDNLRQALARLLESGGERLTVTDGDQQVLGQLSFDDLRLTLRATESSPVA